MSVGVAVSVGEGDAVSVGGVTVRSGVVVSVGDGLAVTSGVVVSVGECGAWLRYAGSCDSRVADVDAHPADDLVADGDRASRESDGFPGGREFLRGAESRPVTAVIPSAAPKARSRGIAGIPKESFRSTGLMAIPRLRRYAFARNDSQDILTPTPPGCWLGARE